MRPLSGLSPVELTEVLRPLPAYRARQIFRWLIGGCASFDEMKNLPLELRADLAARFRLYSTRVCETLKDRDSTVKLGIGLEDGGKIESVLLRDGRGRGTACLSTQVGCPAGCVFCKTGSLGFKRNLRGGEIAEQFFHIRSIERDVSHIVIMGMGEPLLNLGELRKALEIFHLEEGFNISMRRITLSTCGIPAGIRDLADSGPDIRLALSLTTAREGVREKLMPLSRSNPLGDVKESLRYYQKRTKRRITLEAVLLGGINTGQEDAEAMIAFARGFDAVINLISWNRVEGLRFEGRPLVSPKPVEIAAFASALERGGLKVTRRFRKGNGIQGACGQLGDLDEESAKLP